MATREGARAIGQEAELGSIEPGKLADVIVVRTDRLHQAPAADPYSTLVYASRASDVRATIVGGTVVWRDGALAWGEPGAIAEDARRARHTLYERAGV
jgi:5-methylthioadenosine/S-adenosylhomocysteine deaminase